MDYTLILREKYAGSEWTLNGDDYEGLTWLSDSKKPTKAELEAHWDSLKTYWEDKKAQADADRNSLIEKLGLTEAEANLLILKSI
jgi:hypothetical protein